MPRKTQGPTSKFSPKPLDTELFHKLFDILHDDCMDGNYSATARVLGINRLTAHRWARTAPTGPWWNHILRAAIQETYVHMATSKHKRLRRKARLVRGHLEQSGLSQLREYMEFNENNQSGATRHLLVQICKHPQGQLTSQDLQRPGIAGRFNYRSMRRAAADLHLDVVTQGFGEDKITYYRLPYPESQ